MVFRDPRAQQRDTGEAREGIMIAQVLAEFAEIEANLDKRARESARKAARKAEMTREQRRAYRKAKRKRARSKREASVPKLEN